MAGYNPYATNSYQGTQMFPQPQGNVYTLNNSMEIANIPVSGGISVGICPSENLMYMKPTKCSSTGMTILNEK